MTGLFAFSLLFRSLSFATKSYDEILVARLVWLEGSHGTTGSCFRASSVGRRSCYVCAWHLRGRASVRSFSRRYSFCM